MILVVALAAMAGLSLLVPVLARQFGKDTGYFLSAGFLVVGVILTPSVFITLRGGMIAISVPWIPALDVNFTLRLDGLASLFALLVLGVGSLIMAYCPRYLYDDGHHARTYVLLTLFAAAMLGLVLAADLVLLFVFWELTTISSFFLIGGTGPQSGRPAMRALVITFSGGLALLGAVVLIAVETGTTYLPAILANPQWILDSDYAWAIGALIVLAAFTKSAQLPFQSWLPGAMVAITPVSAYLHAATMVKAGVYLLMRFSPVFRDQTGWELALVGVGLVTAVVGAALALRQHDLKALLAYSTVSQLGLLVAVTGVGTGPALAAAILHTFAHALFKATLFMLVGIIDREAGSRDVRELGGLRRVMPVTAALTGLAGLSMAGVPPLIGFVSKESIFQGLSQADFAPWAGPVAATLGVIASALTFAYGVRIFHGAFAGPTTQRQLYEPAWQFLAPAAVPALVGLVLGPAVSVLDPLVRSAVARMAPQVQPPHVQFWHGFSLEILLSVVTISIGLALFFARDPVDQFLQRIRTPAEGELFDRGLNGLVTAGAALGLPHRTGATWAYLVWPVLGLVTLGGVALGVLGGWPRPADGTSWGLDWPLVGLLAVASVGLVVTTRRLVAVVLLGTIGIMVTSWFLLAGAPDVALTLLLVETLTAVVAMLVLRVLPARFRAMPPRRAIPAALVALAAGVVTTAGTLAFTGHRERSGYGTYFLDRAEAETGGTNVVNTILVDFRALDTLGEATVLGIVAVGLILLLQSTTGAPAPQELSGPEARVPEPAGHGPGPRRADRPGPGRFSNSLLFQLTNRVLAPAMLLLSVYLFLRGHSAPGGGFIAALVAGGAIAYGWIAEGTPGGSVPVLRALRAGPLVGAGIMVCALDGLAATALGDPFLTPLHISVAGLTLNSSMVFDLGVYLIVLGLVTSTVARLGATPQPDESERPRAAEPAEVGS